MEKLSAKVGFFKILLLLGLSFRPTGMDNVNNVISAKILQAEGVKACKNDLLAAFSPTATHIVFYLPVRFNSEYTRFNYTQVRQHFINTSSSIASCFTKGRHTEFRVRNG